MAEKIQYVRISLQEYKELLLKDKPAGSRDGEMLERLLDSLANEIKYSEHDYYSDYLMDNMEISRSSSNKTIKEFLSALKYIDTDKYMTVWNKVMTKHRKAKEIKMKIEQMNKAKEMRKENE